MPEAGVIHVFSGDAFLAARAFANAVRETSRERGLEVVHLAEGLDEERLRAALAQGGLFGRPLLALDLDAAFAGASGATAERNALVALLEAAPDDACVMVLDPAATPARQKRWRSLGRLEHVPTPRYGNLVRWVRTELEALGLRTRGDVAATLADLFGEDLPGIVAELSKLRVLDEELTPQRVTELVQRPAARNAFHLIDAVMAGDAATAFATLDALLQAGEPPIRVMGAFGWQVDLVAGCVGLRDADPAVDKDRAAAALKANPFATGKALAIAGRLDEAGLRSLIETVVAADTAMKRGGDAVWHLHACVWRAARLMAARPARGVRARAGRTVRRVD